MFEDIHINEVIYSVAYKFFEYHESADPEKLYLGRLRKAAGSLLAHADAFEAEWRSIQFAANT